MSNGRHLNRPSRSLIMPSSAEKSRERVKRWKKENPEQYKEQRKRYNRKHANAKYERFKKRGDERNPNCTRLRNNGRDGLNESKQQSSMIRHGLAFSARMRRREL